MISDNNGNRVREAPVSRSRILCLRHADEPRRIAELRYLSSFRRGEVAFSSDQLDTQIWNGWQDHLYEVVVAS